MAYIRIFFLFETTLSFERGEFRSENGGFPRSFIGVSIGEKPFVADRREKSGADRKRKGERGGGREGREGDGGPFGDGQKE